MALKDFALLAKVEDLDVYSHKICQGFNKAERHVLSAEIRHTLAHILHLIIRATKEQLEERRLRRPLVQTKELLRQCDVELEYLKCQIRKAYALRLINESTYGAWAQRVIEVGAMLGAWIKKVEGGAPPPKASSPRAAQPRAEGAYKGKPEQRGLLDI